MEWVATVVVIVLVIVLMDGVRMVQNPKREVGSSGTGLIRCAIHIATLDRLSACRYSDVVPSRFLQRKQEQVSYACVRYVEICANDSVTGYN